MTSEQIARAVPAGARVVVAGMVSARGDEDRTVVDTVLRTVDSWGATVVATVLQRQGVARPTLPGSPPPRDPIHQGTFFVAGKVRELATAVRDGKADCVVVCNALTVRHCQNLEDAVGVPVYGCPPGG